MTPSVLQQNWRFASTLGADFARALGSPVTLASTRVERVRADGLSWTEIDCADLSILAWSQTERRPAKRPIRAKLAFVEFESICHPSVRALNPTFSFGSAAVDFEEATRLSLGGHLAEVEASRATFESDEDPEQSVRFDIDVAITLVMDTGARITITSFDTRLIDGFRIKPGDYTNGFQSFREIALTTRSLVH